MMNQGKIIQADTAKAVYTRPASGFVASFMGNYNLLTAEQARQLLGLKICGKLAIRPESIYIREPGRDYGPAMTPAVPARIAGHQLLGNVIRYHVQAAGCLLTVDRLNRGADALLAIGSSLELVFNSTELKEVA
ncbi:hypothetical protein GCM10022394_10920 [Zobellella aerophila]|uniref:Transport-associated OB type 2 domain-containing protein n=1 Tax=Zobellella aerophila TaxID=870480 RepID=A0ABP6VEG0_9GAMM